MNDAELPDEDEIRAEILDAPPAFPQAGVSLVPTAEDIAAGRFGNGAWNLVDGSVEEAQKHRLQQKRDELDERRQFFNEAAKDALIDAVDLHHRAIRAGQRVMTLVEEGADLSKTEQFILSKGLSSAKELSDRAAGRAKITSEHTENVSTLSMLITKDVTE